MAKCKINGNYLEFDKDGLKLNKIFASKFGAYAGYDNFNKAGDAFLKAIKVLEDDPFDPFYGARGEYAEHILVDRLRNSGSEFKYLGRTESGKVFDIFENNPVFGGVPDVILKKKDKNMIVECKSKNIKDYEKMSKGADPNHIEQAMLYAFLSGVDTFIITYIFFTNAQEQVIRERMKESDDFINCNTLFDFNYEQQHLTFAHKVDVERIKSEMQNAYEKTHKWWEESRVPLSEISAKALKKLGVEDQKPFDIFAVGIDFR